MRLAPTILLTAGLATSQQPADPGDLRAAGRLLPAVQAYEAQDRFESLLRAGEGCLRAGLAERAAECFQRAFEKKP